MHIKSLHSHRVRALLASRKAILAKCVDLENELRGLLRVFGIRLAPRVGHGAFDAQVRQTFADDEMLSCALVPLLDARTVLYKTYLKLDNAVKALTKADPLCVRLISIPGVGPVTVLTFKSAVDDPARFKASRMVAAHLGLTPKRYQSGEMDNPGHISRAGDADVRSALYVAAHSLLTRNAQWSSLKAWGMRLALQGVLGWISGTGSSERRRRSTPMWSFATGASWKFRLGSMETVAVTPSGSHSTIGP